MRYEEFVDLLNLLNETAIEHQEISEKEAIDSLDAKKALKICDELKIKSDEDILLFLASMNLLNAYAKQKGAEFGYSFKKDLSSLCNQLPGFHWPSLLKMDLQKDKKTSLLLVSLGNIQFSFHSVPDSLAIPERFAEELEWDGIKKQPCALTLFEDTLFSRLGLPSKDESEKAKGQTSKSLDELALGDEVLIDGPSGLKYRIYEDGSCAIVGMASPASRIAIPDECEGHIVRSIFAKAFYKAESLRGVRISRNVELIGPYSFAGCSSLKLALVPDDARLSSIRWGAFEGCPRSPFLKRLASLCVESDATSEAGAEEKTPQRSIPPVRPDLSEEKFEYCYVANCLPKSGHLPLDDRCFRGISRDIRDRLKKLSRGSDTPFIFTFDEERNEAWLLSSLPNDEETLVVPDVVKADERFYLLERVCPHSLEECHKLKRLIFLDGASGFINSGAIRNVPEIYLLGPVRIGRKGILPIGLTVYTPFSKREYERRAGFYIDPENLSRFVFNYDMSEIAPLLEKYRV